jgi:hypothetical protein
MRILLKTQYILEIKQLFNFGKEQGSLYQVSSSRDCPLKYDSTQVTLCFYELLTKLAHVYGRPGRLSVCKNWQGLLHSITLTSPLTSDVANHG